MKLAVYTDAVNDIPVSKTSAFLKTQSEILEIENWNGLRAPEKRTQFIEALGVSIEFRKNFVAFYNEVKGTDQDWMEWEGEGETPELEVQEEMLMPGEAEPSEEPVAEEPVVEDAEVVSETPKPTKAKPKAKPVSTATETFGISKAGTSAGVYVEGAFEQIVADAAGLDADQSTSALRSVEEDLEFQHMKIGILLAHISKSQHFLTLGYANMREYLDAETGIHYRKGMHLIQNAVAVQELNIPAEELKGVSWSALRHVLPVLSDSNYKTWMEAARSMKHVPLIQAVNEQKVKDAGNALPKPTLEETAKDMTNKTFAVHGDQKEIIDQAIAKAKVEGNTDSAGAALEVIAAAYTGAPASKSTVGSVLPDLTDDGLLTMFSKIQADEGDAGLVRILNVLDQLFPEVTMTVDFGEDATEDAA